MGNLKRLNLIVTYPMDTCVPKIDSDIKREYWGEIIEDFLVLQMGYGKDPATATDKPVYRIHLQLDVGDDDAYYVESDCGNRGLRNGILMDTLTKIHNNTVEEACP